MTPVERILYLGAYVSGTNGLDSGYNWRFCAMMSFSKQSSGALPIFCVISASWCRKEAFAAASWLCPAAVRRKHLLLRTRKDHRVGKTKVVPQIYIYMCIMQYLICTLKADGGNEVLNMHAEKPCSNEISGTILPNKAVKWSSSSMT